MPTDPVCGMFVPETSKLNLTKDGIVYYFCSTDCLNKFKSPEEQVKSLRNRLAVSWLFSVPVLIVNYMPDFPSRLLLMLGLSLPVQFYSGFGFYEGAYQSIKNRMGNMDILITLGTLTAFFFSLFVTIFPNLIAHSQPYYDASVFIITLILTGNYIEGLTKKSAGDAASKLMQLLPRIAHKVEGESIVDVPADTIVAGDTIAVKAGEVLLADGRVTSGEGDIDTSSLTGEQEPAYVGVGDKVTSGTKNLNGTLFVQVERAGSDSTISKIYTMLQSATSGRAKIQRIADIFSAYFVPVILLAASISAISWAVLIYTWGTGQWEIPVLVFVSVVVIACPCAIGLAAPIAMLISSSYSYSNGIIIKNASSLDRLSKVNRVIFDKTGTLTENTPDISSVVSNMPRGEVLRYASAIESYSNHPVARAINEAARREKVAPLIATEINEMAGKGIQGTVEGKTVEIFRSTSKGSSSVDFLINGEKAGEIVFEYKLRSGAQELISELKTSGIKCTLVTGDKESEAARISQLLGLDTFHAECTPEEKAKIVGEYQQNGDYVLFVGDGINDAVAIETADAGIAMSEASDIAKDVGDIILAKNDILLVSSAMGLSKETIRKVRQNIFWAIGYNSALIPIAAGILVPVFGVQMYSVLPILAALAMGFSSTSVVVNSLLLKNRLRSKVFQKSSTGIGSPVS